MVDLEPDEPTTEELTRVAAWVEDKAVPVTFIGDDGKRYKIMVVDLG